MELCEMVVRVFSQLDALFIFPPPLPYFRREHAASCDVSVHDGVNNQREVPVLMCNKVTKVLFNFIFQYKRGSNFAGAVTAWANFLRVDAYFRLHALARDLHKPELRNR